MDDIDRQQCQDIACGLEGHQRCQPTVTVDEMAGIFNGPDSVEWLRDHRCREVDYDLGDVLSVQVSEG